jgi:hypothetical protein
MCSVRRRRRATARAWATSERAQGPSGHFRLPYWLEQARHACAVVLQATSTVLQETRGCWLW